MPLPIWILLSCAAPPDPAAEDTVAIEHDPSTVTQVPEPRDPPEPCEGPTALYGGGRFFDYPWPSDRRRRSDGTLDMTGFPLAEKVPIVQSYVTYAETQTGFSTLAPVYVRFEPSLDPLLLPLLPEDTIAANAPIRLVEVTTQTAVPYEWKIWDEPGDYVDAGLLAVRPLVPLLPATTYVLVVSTDVACPAELPESDDAVVEAMGLDEVAAATVFTTADPRLPMQQLADSIATTPQVIDLDFRDFDSAHMVFEGEIEIPIWQKGTSPYAEEGGFEIVDGQVVVQRTETTAFALSIPRSTMPATGWPLVLWRHGLTESYETYLVSNKTFVSESRRLAEGGLASLSVNAPMHGDRGFATDYLLTWQNAEGAAHALLQAAGELLYLARALQGDLRFTYGGDEIELDEDGLTGMGVTWGAMQLAVAGPYFDERLQAIVQVTTGGGTTEVLVNSSIPIVDLFNDSWVVTTDDLDVFHPILALLQLASDPGDPLNHARSMLEEPPVAPRHQLILETAASDSMPPEASQSLTRASGMPFVEPLVFLPDELAFLTDTVVGPVSLNVSGVTAGTVQSNDMEIGIYDNDALCVLYQDFLHQAAYGGVPEIWSVLK